MVIPTHIVIRLPKVFGYSGIAWFFPFLFVKKTATDVTVRHEIIHNHQAVPFVLVTVILGVALQWAWWIILLLVLFNVLYVLVYVLIYLWIRLKDLNESHYDAYYFHPMEVHARLGAEDKVYTEKLEDVDAGLWAVWHKEVKDYYKTLGSYWEWIKYF